MSVQASSLHYCTPRDDFAEYTHIEIGYPSSVEPALEPYSDGGTGVYGFVPVEIAEAIIKKHGGIKNT